ncbi:procathepsin L-like [Sitodiplosis mosellana]|uniref:procathepsin L-like n=1 Tax=Sitodiplosis mosellana TaxID=263140 RepID=UPI002444FAA9|nr:procathepsin L-like [Sitodiplosis mosellana]
MTKLLIVLFGLCAVVNAVSPCALNEWNAFKLQYSKQYQNETEENYRMEVFSENKRTINEHNDLYAKGLVSYKMDINQYSDLTSEEFVRRMNGVKPPDMLQSVQGAEAEERDYFVGSVNFHLPKMIDWRKVGAVSEVKDQKDCGSCWAFAATSAIESQQYLKKNGPLQPLSVQNLIDCASISLFELEYMNTGCDGGIVDEAYKYVKDHGIDTEKSYPYRASNGFCKHSFHKNHVFIRGFKDIPRGNELKLQEAIATVGPISVAVDASQMSFQHYKSGIYNETNCSSDTYDHSALIVGYGTDENGADYYIVKNCWGRDWGEDGYIRMPRNQNNHCSIASYANYPVV